MASGYLSAELTATCNALGYYDGQTYHLEPHCSETAKDLIRYLRRDDDSHEIRRFFGNTKIVQTDLLPIIQCHPENQELFDVVLRLLVNLTNPAFLVYKESIPKDKAVRNQYLDLVSHLQAAKEAFTQHKPWDVIAEKLSLFLNTEEHLRDDDMRRNIERILILVRNVLHVPDSDGEARPDNDASIHDQVLWALHQSGMLDLILYIASSPQEECFYMHILEVICLMVREQPAVLLGQAASTRSNEEKNRDSDELLAIRKRESLANQQKIRKYQGMRNFGGTYVIKNMKSTSDKDIIYHKPIQNFNKISLDLEKKKIKIPKNRQPLKCFNVERRSALSVRLILKQFCIEILNAAYNPLMKTVKDSLVRGRTQDNDESYYFNAMTFFMEFNRSYKYQVKLVSETLSVESFHFIQKYLETWHEMMVTDKGKIHLWSTRMHFALKAYKELLYNLAEMDKNEDEGVKESSRVIKSNIFYVIEYREMLLLLMNSYKKPKFSLKYLCDLIETVHIFLKLLENFAKNKKMFVQKKVSRPRKKNNKKSVKQNQKGNLEDIWITLSSELSTAIESPVDKEVFPFDAASDVPMDDQKITAVKKIQNLLKSGDFEEAVAFLRASREVWPENDTFGRQDCSPEDELACFKEVFLADLDADFPGDDMDCAPLSEEEEDSYPPPVEERSFDVSDFLKSFANPRVVYICGLLLQSFELNSKAVNHCIAKMFHRIAWDCKVPSMIFQASIFRSFQRILASHNPSHQELATLAKFIVRKFVEVSADNKKLLMELLFWKSSKDAYDIEVGYGSYQEKSKAAKIVWEEHEEDELRRLYMEFKETHPDEEMTSDNVVPWITRNLIKDRSEKSVAKKLKEMLLVIGKAKKKPLWSRDEEEQLKSLFEEFRGSDDPVGQIMERMPDRSRRTINSTLLKLNVVYDRSELKPKKKSRRRNSYNDDKRHNDTDSSDSSSDQEDDRVNLDEEKMKQRKLLDRPRLNKSIHELINFSSARQYLVDGVEWLHESMKDNVEDCEDDPTEVPLLPLSESAIKCVDDKLFQNFLLSLGLFSPFQQQEIYWRFPSTWNSEEYAKRIDLISMVIEHCKDDSHQLSTNLKDFISNKFGERISSSCEDQDASDEDLNATKEDCFDSLVAQQCKETLDNYSASVKDPFDNLLYSKSDDESHKETAYETNKKSKKRSKNTRLNSSNEDSDRESDKLSKNPFMSKIKELAKNKMNLNKFVKDDTKEPDSKKKNTFNSDSESDKENDTNNELNIKDSQNHSPLQKSANKTKKKRILLNSDESDSESSNMNDNSSKNKIFDNDDKNTTPNGKSSLKLSDSDDSDTENNINRSKLSTSSVQPKRNRLISDSEESQDEDKIENTPKNDHDKDSVKSVELSPDSQVNSVQKRPRISLDSDEETEESQANSVSNKRRHIIESDED